MMCNILSELVKENTGKNYVLPVLRPKMPIVEIFALLFLEQSEM